MVIFEPAMCCSTGVCGPSVDKELLRVSMVLNNLKKNGIIVERHNLSGSPQAFVDNKEINRLINEHGTDILPITMVDGKEVKRGHYPTNHEFCEFLDVKSSSIRGDVPKIKKGCGCKDGCC